jgi:hypothetical protein
MNRSCVVSAAIVVWTVCAPNLTAQTVAPGDGWVVLPVDEYRALRDRANPAPAAPAAPPVEATVTRIDYDLRVDTDSVTGRALITIDVLKDGWTRVQIPPGLRARDARLDGQPVSLIEGPPPRVLLARTGRSVLTLDIVMPLAVSAGTESIALPASPSSISHVTLTLPKSGVDLSVTGGFVTEHVESAGESRWTAYGRPNQPMALSWKRKVDDRRAELPVRLRARLTTLAGVNEDVCLTSTAVRIDVVQGLARELVLALPPGLVVNQVTGSTVGDWSTSGGLLRVRPLEPVATETSFVVQGEARVPRDGAVAVPLLRMPSAERETGGVAVDVGAEGDVSERQVSNLDPADPSELGDIVAGRESPSMLAFRMKPLSGTEPRSLSITVIRYRPQPVLIANIEEARYRVLASDDGRVLVHARYAIRNNQRSFLKLSLPQGATVWSAEVAGRPVRPGVAEPDGVLLPLEKGRAGAEAPTFAADLVYLQRTEAWTDRGRARLDLPALDLPVSRTGLELYYSPRFRVDPQPGTFRISNDPGVFAEAFRQPGMSIKVTAEEFKTSSGLQALVDRYRNESAGSLVVGALPVHVTVPAVGPSLFLACELTEEGHAPSVELTLKRARS